jgi:hypothetical protein
MDPEEERRQRNNDNTRWGGVRATIRGPGSGATKRAR